MFKPRTLKTKTRKWIIVLIVIIVAIIYLKLNPASSKWFPVCLFKVVTGYDCPGCGSQRMIHHLLNLQFKEALKANALLLVLIPYIIAGLIFDFIRHRKSYTGNTPGALFFGKTAIIILIIVVIVFTIIRNTTLYHNLIGMI